MNYDFDSSKSRVDPYDYCNLEETKLSLKKQSENNTNLIKNDPKYLEKENDRILQDGYITELSSFDYLPPKFLGINTKLFGQTVLPHDCAIHPFFQLKQMAMDINNSYDDRFQCVRYMTHIPYVNGNNHCIESSQHILQDETIEVNKRFYFFSNNDKYCKLNDYLVHALHPFFFELGKKLKYPLKILLISARYVFSFYPLYSDERNSVLDFVMDIADDENEDEYSRSECADILYSIGDQEEVIFGMKILQEIGYMDQDLNKTTIYSNTQNVHDETINSSVRKIIMTLHKDYLLLNLNLLGNCSLEYLHKIFSDELKSSDDQNQKLQSFFMRLMTDPTKFENLTLVDIFIIVFHKIQSFIPEIKDECFKRLVEEINESDNTCHTGYVSRLVNVLSGFVQEDRYMFTINPKDELRSAVFARINASMTALPPYLKEDVLNSLWSDDKTTFEEFYNLYTPEEELKEEYKEILSEEEFMSVYQKALKDFQSI